MLPSPTLSDEDLEDQLTQSFACLQAATCQWLALLAEFDRRKGWTDWGIRSCAHWLNWKCGIDLGAAREKVRVAKALADLPQISRTFEQGRLSYSKVRAVTRAATPENESDLLNIALHGTAAQVEKLVRKYRQMEIADELAESQHAGRFLRYRHDEDGSLIVTVRLPAEDGASFIKAIEAALEEVPENEQEFLRKRGSTHTRRKGASVQTSGAPTRSPSWRNPFFRMGRRRGTAATATR